MSARDFDLAGEVAARIDHLVRGDEYETIRNVRDLGLSEAVDAIALVAKLERVHDRQLPPVSASGIQSAILALGEQWWAQEMSTLVARAHDLDGLMDDLRTMSSAERVEAVLAVREAHETVARAIGALTW